MTAIDFPNTPTVGQAFSADGKTWIYNGTVWGLRTATATRDAYDIAVDNGFTGTESQWLASLQGEDGIIGVDGRFEVSATAPSSPVEGDAWFNSVTARTYLYYDSYWVEVGAAVSGQNGPSAYQVALDNGFVGTEADWLATLDPTAALAALVDSAPTTLDTLNELAAALGDDANFSTTVTNALASKASTGKAIAMAIVFGG